MTIYGTGYIKATHEGRQKNIYIGKKYCALPETYNYTNHCNNEWLQSKYFDSLEEMFKDNQEDEFYKKIIKEWKWGNSPPNLW